MNQHIRNIVLIFITTMMIMPAQSEGAQEKVVLFNDDDPEMNAAIVRARNSLPLFWSKFGNPAPNESGFTIKVHFSNEQSTEHLWCTEVTRVADTISCTINNDPESVHSVKYGDRVEVDESRISDWLYLLDDKVKGAETLRIIMTRVSEEEAASYRAMLAAP